MSSLRGGWTSAQRRLCLQARVCDYFHLLGFALEQRDGVREAQGMLVAVKDKGRRAAKTFFPGSPEEQEHAASHWNDCTLALRTRASKKIRSTWKATELNSAETKIDGATTDLRQLRDRPAPAHAPGSLQ